MSTVHEDFVQDLNEYFGALGFDEHYVEHVSVDIKRDTCATLISSTQVFNALGQVKKKDVSRPHFYKKKGAGGRAGGLFCYLLFPIAFFLYTLLPSPGTRWSS